MGPPIPRNPGRCCFGSVSNLRACKTGPKPDVDCLVVSMRMIGSGDPPISKAGEISIFYWLGKPDDRDPSYDLENNVADEVQSMSPQTLHATSARCGAEMAKRGQSLHEIGEQLQRRAAQQNAPKSPS
jgi:hypothetical protein